MLAMKSRRSLSTKQYCCLVVVSAIASSRAVAAYVNIPHHGQIRTFGSVGRTGTSMPYTTLQQHGFNRGDSNSQHLQSRKATVCRGTKEAYIPETTAPTSDQLKDIDYMKLAIEAARIGSGNTFPNPAVGCVLVRHGGEEENDTIVGSGFHPKAGMPHAEVFALFEACGHVEDGVAAAKSVMGRADDNDDNDNEALEKKVLDLLTEYKSEDGASELFGDHFAESDITAYVTLEPCCHTGQTPPCALSLVKAGVNRVVVGTRDPNPRVDGGGIAVLQNADVDVHVLGSPNKEGGASREEKRAAEQCSNLVRHFVKRISPREESEESLDDVITGKKRRVLRSIAGRQKIDGTIQQLEWPKDNAISPEDKTSVDYAEQVPLDHRFLERIDQSLWDHEIALLRLNKVVSKKKGAKIVGGRIAEELGAHVAQVIGHTALLYRPGFPPVLDLDELLVNEDNE